MKSKLIKLKAIKDMSNNELIGEFLTIESIIKTYAKKCDICKIITLFWMYVVIAKIFELPTFVSGSLLHHSIFLVIVLVITFVGIRILISHIRYLDDIKKEMIIRQERDENQI